MLAVSRRRSSVVARISWSSRLSRASRLGSVGGVQRGLQPERQTGKGGSQPVVKVAAHPMAFGVCDAAQLVPGASQLVGELGRMGRVGQRRGEVGQQPVLLDIELASRPRRDDDTSDRFLAAAQVRERSPVPTGRRTWRPAPDPGPGGSARYPDPRPRPPVSRCRGASRPRHRHRPGGSRAGSTWRKGCAVDRRGTGRRPAARWCEPAAVRQPVRRRRRAAAIPVPPMP